MSRPGFRDLIGRAMVDEDFRQALIVDPAAVLADFELEGEERAAIVKAVTQSHGQPKTEQTRALRAVVMKRWAT